MYVEGWRWSNDCKTRKFKVTHLTSQPAKLVFAFESPWKKKKGKEIFPFDFFFFFWKFVIILWKNVGCVVHYEQFSMEKIYFYLL